MSTVAVALTGGIGSGKSTAAAMFARLGVPVLDLDAVGHDCLNDETVKQNLVDVFGEAVLDERGYIHRRALARQAFISESSTAKLNHIVHPVIVRKEKQWLAQQDAPYALIEASVLLESGGESRMDAVIAVMAPLALRKARVLRRGRQDEAMFEKIIARQCTDDERKEKADYLLWNDADIHILAQRVEDLHRQLTRMKFSTP